MDMQSLTTFFMWCSIINGGLLVFWSLLMLSAPDFIYRTQSRWFPIQRQTYDVVIFSFLGIFKVFFIVFNLVPYLALLIMA